MNAAPGARLLHYEIVAPIGKGGMGEVFRASDKRLGRDVAIKVLAATAAGKTGQRRGKRVRPPVVGHLS